MFLTENGKTKVKVYLQENRINSNCADCSKEMIPQDKLFIAIETEMFPNGPKGFNAHCQFKCVECGYEFTLPAVQIGLNQETDYSVS